MAKRKLKLKAKIPNFNKDAREWRKGINAAIVEAQSNQQVCYRETDKLEVEIRLHLVNPKLTVLDLDNRLKDILDALQGFVGDKGMSGELRPIIPNDSQIYRVIVEKRLPPKSDRSALSTIEIRRYTNHGGTVRQPRSSKKKQRLPQVDK